MKRNFRCYSVYYPLPPHMRWMKIGNEYSVPQSFIDVTFWSRTWWQSIYRADYMDMWTTHPYVIIEHVIRTSCSLMCCSNSLHSSGFSLTAEICSHSATRASSELQHWRWVIGSGSQSVLQLIPKVPDGAELRPVKLFHAKLGNPFFNGAVLMLHKVRENCSLRYYCML